MGRKLVSLDESVSAVFDVLGVAVVRIGPTRYQQEWRPRNLAVSTTSTADSEARAYLMDATPGNLLAGTYSGNRDNCPLDDISLVSGRVITVVWSGGTPGATATVSLAGLMEVPA